MARNNDAVACIALIWLYLVLHGLKTLGGSRQQGSSPKQAQHELLEGYPEMEGSLRLLKVYQICVESRKKVALVQTIAATGQLQGSPTPK
jgi:hypothetical protein